MVATIKEIKNKKKEQTALTLEPSVRLKEQIAKRKRTEKKLARYVSLLSATLESTADGILVVNRKGKIVSFNRKFLDIWNIPDHVIESLNDNQVLGLVLNRLKDPEVFLSKVKELYNQPHSESYDILEFMDGRIFERYSQPQRIGERIVGRVWSFRDITELKRTAKALQENEKRLRRLNEALIQLSRSRLIQNGSLDATLKEIAEASARTLEVERVNVWLYNEDRSKIHCCEQYELGTGKHSKGYDLAAADYPSYFKALKEERTIAAHDAYADSRTREFSDSYLTLYGITSLLDAPIRVGGQMVGVICHENIGPARQWTLEEQNFAGSMADFISLALEAWERKRAERALAESEERYRTLVEHSYDLIIEASIDGRFLYLSPNYKELLGYEPSELMGRNIFEHIHPDDRSAVIKEFTRVMETFSSGHASFRFQHKDGEWRWLESSGKPFQKATGEVSAVIASREITERKRAEFLFDLARTKQIDALSMLDICEITSAIAQMQSEERPLSTALIVGDPTYIARILPESEIQLQQYDHIRRVRQVVINLAKIVDGLVLGYGVDKQGYVRRIHKLDVALGEPDSFLLGPQFSHHAAISRQCDAVVFFVPAGGRQVRVFAHGQLVGRYSQGGWSSENITRMDEAVAQLAEQKKYDLPLLRRVFRCAFQMSEENLGAIFLLGDPEVIWGLSDPPEISGFAKIINADVERMSDRELINFAKQDGATVIDVHRGRFRGSMVLLRPRASTQAEIGIGKGARHSSAAKISSEAKCVAITVSQDGPITVYDHGQRILSL
ncbi:MAG: PAS domain S-box protein [Candidatus Dadabacteria bacterium]|nr:PAS domain S-box protein [Candidatus Dadabacteria bacterium]